MNNRFLKIFFAVALLVFGFQMQRMSAQNAPIRLYAAIDSLPVMDSLHAPEIKALVMRVFAASAEIRDTLALRHETLLVKSDSAAVWAARAKTDTTLSAEQKKTLDSQAKMARSQEKAAGKWQQKAEGITQDILQISDADSLKQKKRLPGIFKRYQTLRQEFTEKPVVQVPEKEPVVITEAPRDTVAPTIASQDSSMEKPAVKKEKRKIQLKIPEVKLPEKKVPAYATYDPAKDVMLHPPTPACNWIIETKDAFSGEVHKEEAREELFRHSPRALKNYLQGKPHVIADAGVAKTGDQVFWYINFVINDPNARKAFGNLPRNGIATVKMLDGSTLTLTNIHQDEGEPDKSGQVYTYRAQYSIEADMLKKMRNTGLDKIRVTWLTGFEDYDIQNVDLLRRQLKCL